MKELKRALLFFFVMAMLIAGVYRFLKPGGPDSLPLQRPMDVVELPDGSLLVADGGGYYWNDSGSKILKVGRNKKVSWFYRGNLNFIHGALYLKNGHFLIVDTGKNRLLETDRFKNHMWVSDSWARAKGKLSDGSHLKFPTSAAELKNGRFIVSDSGNGRVLELDRDGKAYFTNAGWKSPGSVRVTPEGNYIVTETGADRIVIIDGAGKTVWQYTNGLSAPADAFSLSNGNVLIADTGHDRVLTVDRDGKTWNEIKGPLNRPNRALVLRNGNVLVCDSGHARLLEFDSGNRVVWDFRNIQDAAPRDELTNGGAEIISKKKPLGWTECDLFARWDGIWKADTNVAHGGNASLELLTLRKPPGKLFWGQVVKAAPGKTAVLSSFVRNELTSGSAGIGLIFLDEWNGTIGASNANLKGMTNDWKEISLSVKVPANAAAVFVQLMLDGEGTAHFDDISLTVKK